MLDVSYSVREAYKEESIQKKLLISIDGGEYIDSKQIYQESMSLHEAIIEGTNVEFVGCISSKFEIDIDGLSKSIKGKSIDVSIVHAEYGGYDEDNIVPLFKGTIDSAKMQGGKSVRHIIAFDKLYTVGQIDVSSWYKNLTFPISLGDLRKSLFAYLDFEYVETELVNDEIVISKQYDPKLLKALSVIKAICQINGCFGIVDRYGKFVFRYVPQGADRESNISVPYYKKVILEEFRVKSFERVQIRQSENVDGVTVGEPSGNKYIIQANMFAYKLSGSVQRTIAQNIYSKIKNIDFYPVDTDNNGLPYIEVGDTVTFPRVVYDGEGGSYERDFIVMSRDMKGIQALRDVYSAKGEEEASEYITDLQTQIDTIKQSGGGGGDIPSDVYSKEEIDDMLIEFPTIEDTMDIVSDQVNELSTPTGFNVVSVYTLPKVREPNTIYLVRGGVIML